MRNGWKLGDLLELKLYDLCAALAFDVVGRHLIGYNWLVIGIGSGSGLSWDRNFPGLGSGLDCVWVHPRTGLYLVETIQVYCRAPWGLYSGLICATLGVVSWLVLVVLGIVILCLSWIWIVPLGTIGI